MIRMTSSSGFMEIRRIYVIGAPGSGKSFLAAKLARVLGIIWYDLDGDDLDAMTEKERTAYIHELRQQTGWICEATLHGLGIEWVRDADVTIILTSPLIVCVMRILIRGAWKMAGKQFPGQLGRESWGSLRFRMGMTWRYKRAILHPFLAELRANDLAVMACADNETAYQAVLRRMNG